MTIVDNKLRFDPGNDLDYLADGESFLVVIDYTMQDEHGVQSSSTLSITVQGEDRRHDQRHRWATTP